MLAWTLRIHLTSCFLTETWSKAGPNSKPILNFKRDQSHSQNMWQKITIWGSSGYQNGSRLQFESDRWATRSGWQDCRRASLITQLAALQSYFLFCSAPQSWNKCWIRLCCFVWGWRSPPSSIPAFPDLWHLTNRILVMKPSGLERERPGDKNRGEKEHMRRVVVGEAEGERTTPWKDEKTHKENK